MTRSKISGVVVVAVAALALSGCGGGAKPAPTTAAPTAPAPVAAETPCPQPVDDPGCVWADDLDACQRNEAAFNACTGDRACRVRCFHDDELDPLRDSIREHADEAQAH
jgi:hypothetical protein